VVAKQTPKEIIADVLDYSDLEAMTKYLSERQKSDAEWDQFRKKIPDDLLDKWQGIMSRCRENGFFRPRVRNGEIVWDQLTANRKDYQRYDKCTICTQTFIAGNCKGKGRLKHNGIMFVPCWQGMGR